MLEMLRGDVMECYGYFEDGEPVCRGCRYAGYCRDAGEQPPKRDDPLPLLTDPADIDRRSYATLGGEIFRRLFDNCGNDPLIVAVVVCRYQGKSYREISRRLKINKNQIHRMLAKLPNRKLSAVLRKSVRRSAHE